jgi:hypothetical protein
MGEKYLAVPGEIMLGTQEGISAFDIAINFMSSMKPVG